MPISRVIDFRDEPLEISRRWLTELPDRVIDGSPSHVTKVRFESSDGALIAGTWISPPGKWRAFSDRDEFCTILFGHVRLIDADGGVQTFRAGKSFLIPNGFRGIWEAIDTTIMHLVICRHVPARAGGCE